MGEIRRAAITVLVTLALVSAPVGAAAAAAGSVGSAGPTVGDGPPPGPTGSANHTGNGSTSLSVVEPSGSRTATASSGGVGGVGTGDGLRGADASSAGLQWDRTYDRGDEDAATAVVQTSDGGYLLAGQTTGSGSTDHWFVKTDASGDQQWERTFGGPEDDRIREVIETDDGYVFVGSRGIQGGSRMVIGKISDSGDSQWLVPVDDDAEPSRDIANSVLQTGDQRFLVAGEVTLQGSGSQQAILFELDVSGTPNLVWSRTYGSDDADAANAVAAASGDGYVFAGQRNRNWSTRGQPGKAWLVRVGPQGTERWTRTFGNGTATDVLGRDGGYVLSGEGGPRGIGGEGSPWVKRIDSARDVVWTGSPPYVSCGGTDLAPRDGGGVAVVGSTCSDVVAPEIFDGWITTYDSTGDRQFNTSLGSSSYSGASAVVTTDDGGYAVAGNTDADSGTGDFWLLKFAGDGTGGGGGASGTVDRVEFDYSEFGGSVNLEVNGTRKVVDNLEDLDGYQIERAVVHVPDPAGGQGSGHVRITGEIGSFSVGGQEFSVDNVTFGAGGREKTVGFDDLRPDQDSYPVGTGFTSVPTGVEMSVVPYVYSSGDRARDTSGSVGSGAYWAGNTNLAFDVGSVFEGSSSPPDVVEESVRIDPYPVETGERPTLTVNVTNTSDGDEVVVRRWVNGTREGEVQLGHTGGGIWTGELPSVAHPGTNVTLEVVARNADGTDTLSRFPGTDEHLGYFAFREVREVGVVLGKFPGETLPETLDGTDALRTWELANEVDLNHFYGSHDGSMGAVGFDFAYHSNGTDLYTVDRTRTEYQALNTTRNPDAGAEQFVSDLRSAASDDVDYGQYAFWVAAHPGTGNDRLINSSTLAYWNPGGVLGNPNGRIYIQTEADEDVWRHEFGHAIGFDHVGNGTEAAAMMSSNDLFLRHFVVPTRVGANGGGVSWLSKNVTNIGDVGDDGTDLVVPTLRSYDLGDSVPTVRVNRWWGYSTTDYTLGSLASVNHTYVWRGNDLLGENELDDPLDSVRDKVGVVGPVCVEFTLMSEEGTGEDFESTVDAEPVPCGRNAVVATLGDRTTVQGSTNGPVDGGPRPDLDLRAVDAQGRITGVTEDGEFVNRIPGARASGDREGLEWISVPENASVRFVVSTAELQRFVRRTGISRSEVTPEYDLSVTRYGDDPQVVTGDDGNVTVSDTATTVTTNATVGVGDTATTSPPVADAGQSRDVRPNETVELDGSGSTDPAGDSLTYRWTQTAGPEVTLADRETATPTFTAPDVDGKRKLTFELTVDDGTTTATDTVTVTVSSPGGPIDRIDDGDGVVEDDELDVAIRLWVTGEFSDAELQVVIDAWVTGG